MILSEIGDLICTPSLKIPISLTGTSCLEETNKFCDSGILLRILSGSNFLFDCSWRTNEWPIEVPIPTWTVLAVPIWLADWYKAILDILAFAGGVTGST